MSTLSGILLFGTSIVLLAATLERKIGPQIVMRADGVHARVGKAWQVIPYAYIAGVTHDASTLTIALHGNPAVHVPIAGSSWTHRGVTEEELHLLAAQILSAAQRAQGAGPEKPEIATRIDVLARGAESPAQCLARVDAAAAGASGAGYRGGAIEEGEQIGRGLELVGQHRGPIGLTVAVFRAGGDRVEERIEPVDRAAPVRAHLRHRRFSREGAIEGDTEEARARPELRQEVEDRAALNDGAPQQCAQVVHGGESIANGTPRGRGARAGSLRDPRRRHGRPGVRFLSVLVRRHRGPRAAVQPGLRAPFALAGPTRRPRVVTWSTSASRSWRSFLALML